MTKRLSIRQLLVFVLSGALGTAMGTGCDHGIEPPLPTWLDTSDGNHSIHPTDSSEASDHGIDPEPSDSSANTATASDTGRAEPEDTSTPNPTDSDSAKGDTDEATASDEGSASVDSETEQAQDSCLVISEYLEGSAKNKGVELLNCGVESLSLQGFTLCTVFNQETQCGKTLDLSEVELEGGVLGPWEVLTVCYSGIDPSFAALCDHTHALAYFNGDDRLVLKHAGSVMDVFGEIALPPKGSPWKDATYRRCDLTPFDGSLPFEVTDLYSVHGIDDFSDFGLPPVATLSCMTP
ncbi:MAG: hypothetical protein MUC50_05995 [Myxococcota bacterium]|nr:hypothetical protein [Myxococcota bacterium]